jgi:hypothetical protein
MSFNPWFSTSFQPYSIKLSVVKFYVCMDAYRASPPTASRLTIIRHVTASNWPVHSITKKYLTVDEKETNQPMVLLRFTHDDFQRDFNVAWLWGTCDGGWLIIKIAVYLLPSASK